MGAHASRAQPTPPPTLVRSAPRATETHEGFLPEILELLATYLVGYDVLQLSHSCCSFRSALSTPAVWQPRVLGRSKATPSWWCAEQEDYFRARSLQFRGSLGLPDHRPRHARTSKLSRGPDEAAFECGDACTLPFMLLPEEDGRLSFDLWFSLLETETPGGILWGLQSQSCFTSDKSPAHIDRFVHVDPQRNLYCSVLVSKPVVAHGLEFDRWYHLFDGKRQNVYLDGVLVSSGVGLDQPQTKWHWVRHSQLGTGFIVSWSQGKPTPEYHGWYPFHGLIDECRVWHDVLSVEQIQQLARGGDVSSKRMFQLSRGNPPSHGGVKRVKCSRPVERVALIHRPRSGPDGS